MGTAKPVYKPQCKTKDGVDSLEDWKIEKILFQMKNCICKILKENDTHGTGFFCKIPYDKSLLYLQIIIF